MNRFIQSLARPWKRFILLCVDLVLVPVSLFAAFGLQLASLWPMTAVADVWTLFPLTLILAAAFSLGLGIPNIKLNAFETKAIMKTGVFAALLALSTAAISGLAGVGISSAVFIVFGIVFFSLSVTSRLMALRLLIWLYRNSQICTRVLVYGAGATGVQLVAAIGQSADIDAVGFIDDNLTLQNLMVAGLHVYAPAHAPKLIAANNIDRVVLAMPSLSPPRQAKIVQWLEKTGVDVQRIPSFSELIGEKGLVNKIEPARPHDFLGRNQFDEVLPGITDSYADNSIFVSGAGGSIGSELCRQLLACDPSRIILFEQSEAALYSIDLEMRTLAEGSEVKIIPVIGSVCNPIQTAQVMRDHNVDIVLHAAAHKHVPLVEANEIEGIKNNVLGTKILANSARESGVKNFVLVSSDKAVRPANVMGASKRLAELVVQDMATRSNTTLFSMVRFGNVLGSSGSVIPLFQDQISKGGPVTLTHKDITRYFMTIPEATRLVLLAGSFARGGDVFVLDMGEQIQIRSLAEQMVKRAGYTVRSDENPDGDIAIEITGLRPGEKLFEELLIGSEMLTTPHPKILRAMETQLSELEIAKALQDISKAVDSGNAADARALLIRWVDGYHVPKHAARV